MNFNQIDSIRVKKDVGVFKSGEEYKLSQYDKDTYYIQKDANKMFTRGILANLKLGKLTVKIKA